MFFVKNTHCSRNFREANLTAMHKEEWYCGGSLALLMHEMHVDLLESIDGDGRLELWHLIELLLLLSPVEAILPVLCQSLHIRSGVSQVLLAHKQ